MDVLLRVEEEERWDRTYRDDDCWVCGDFGGNGDVHLNV
jgi:hypothetical protein